ncbi:hypothetical protein COMNV_00950 [Commensalibacter sp. Nvir]|uniref:ABC transporter substrate-binding protein n=1 Tax=Commensalibacter sp. Nvir TaxID=3069817 RepID=UPI002D3216B2|nr:hypothetical protein COMNV_00950 [Commensalibacter sp. Nvir]
MSSYKQSHQNFVKRRKTIFSLASMGMLAGAGLYSYTLKNERKLSKKTSVPLQTVRIAWPHSHQDALFNVACANNFFVKNSLNVQLSPQIQTSQDALNAFKANKCDAIVMSALDWIPELISGLKGKLLVGTGGSNFRLLVSKHRRIDRLADLNKLKIAVGPGGQKEKLFLSILLRRKGINPDQNISWIETEEKELLPTLLSNRVQAIITSDPLAWQILTAAKKQLYELAGSQTGSWSVRINYVLGVSDHFLNNYPDTISPLAKSIRMASMWQKNNLKKTSDLLTESLKPMSSQDILLMLQHQNQNIAPINNKLWEQIAQYLDEFKLLNLLPMSLNSAKTARQFCYTIKT